MPPPVTVPPYQPNDGRGSTSSGRGHHPVPSRGGGKSSRGGRSDNRGQRSNSRGGGSTNRGKNSKQSHPKGGSRVTTPSDGGSSATTSDSQASSSSNKRTGDLTPEQLEAAQRKVARKRYNKFEDFASTLGATEAAREYRHTLRDNCRPRFDAWGDSVYLNCHGLSAKVHRLSNPFSFGETLS